MTTMNTRRYASSADAIPAPDTPTVRSNTGSQQQLDAMIADTTVPILATNSPRLDDEPPREVESV